MPRYCLFYNLSFSRCYLKLLDSFNKTIDVCEFQVEKNLIQIINPILNKLLEKNSINWDCIDRVYFTNGPGNFTGIRVSVSIAKTIFLVHPRIQFYTINNLKWIANGHGICAIDANSFQVYLAVYEKQKCICAPIIINKDELDKWTNEYHYLPFYHVTFDHIIFNETNEIINEFEKVDDMLNLEPFYLKEPV